MAKKADKAVFTLPIESWNPIDVVIPVIVQYLASIAKCPDYTNQPEVQAHVKATQTAVTDLSTTLTELAAAKALVATLEGRRDQESIALHANHGALETTVNVACKGQLAMIKAYGGEPLTRIKTPFTTDPPRNTGLGVGPDPGSVLARCKGEKGVMGYVYQWGDSPANPDAWPEPTIVSTCRLVIPKLTVGQKVYARIAILRRRGGQGQWSPILETLVR